MRRSLFLLTGLLLLLPVAVAPATAGPLASDPLVQASSTSPLAAGCGLGPAGPDAVFGEGQIDFDTEVEPWVDVNPTDPDNIVAFWQQDRWSNGGARSNVAGVSFDGGDSWTNVVVPGLSDCSGGSFERASDPWVSFGPDGTLHQVSLLIDIETPPNRTGGFGPSALAVSKSVDGGLNWTDPILVAENANPRFLHDKESITADPTDPDFVYVVWDQLKLGVGDVINPERVPGNLAFKGAAMFTRSTDGGDTWEAPRVLYDPGAIAQTIGNQLVVLPDGTLVTFFDEILGVRGDAGFLPFNLSLKFSRDNGQTWLPRGRPIRTNKILPLSTVTPDEEIGIRDGAVLFDVAVDPANGNLYAVWQDARFSGFELDEIAFSMSTDGGFNWTNPIKVNATPPNAENPLRQQAFLPSVEVAGGTVGVSYYDFRNDTDTGELADHFLIHCHGSCGNPANWGDEVRVTDTSFDYEQAPIARELFLGDYVGLASDGTDFLSFFPQSSAADAASGFFRRVGP